MKLSEDVFSSDKKTKKIVTPDGETRTRSFPKNRIVFANSQQTDPEEQKEKELEKQNAELQKQLKSATRELNDIEYEKQRSKNRQRSKKELSTNELLRKKMQESKLGTSIMTPEQLQEFARKAVEKRIYKALETDEMYHTFKKKEEPVKEESEQIDELRKSTLSSYIDKAAIDISDKSFDAGKSYEKSDGTTIGKVRKAYKRVHGIQKAVDKIRKEETDMKDVEQLDELSKDTLASYAKKAARSVGTNRAIASDFESDAQRARGAQKKKISQSIADRFRARSFRRADGVAKAVDRLTKEEAEDQLLTYSEFMEALYEGRAQYMVKAVHPETGRTKVTNYVADKDESEGEVRSRAERDHKASGFKVDTVRRKDIEADSDDEEGSAPSSAGDAAVKRGRGRPKGSKNKTGGAGLRQYKA